MNLQELRTWSVLNWRSWRISVRGEHHCLVMVTFQNWFGLLLWGRFFAGLFIWGWRWFGVSMEETCDKLIVSHLSVITEYFLTKQIRRFIDVFLNYHNLFFLLLFSLLRGFLINHLFQLFLWHLSQFPLLLLFIISLIDCQVRTWSLPSSSTMLAHFTETNCMVLFLTVITWGRHAR